MTLFHSSEVDNGKRTFYSILLLHNDQIFLLYVHVHLETGLCPQADHSDVGRETEGGKREEKEGWLVKIMINHAGGCWHSKFIALISPNP